MKTFTTAAAVISLAAPALAQGLTAPVDPTAPVGTVTLQVSRSEQYGEYIASEQGQGEEGRPVYVFSTDIPAAEGHEARMTCLDDQCQTAWRPVAGGVELADGLAAELLGTIAHEGQQIALYGGWPLYHYETDQVPTTEEPQGHGEVSFGGTWYLISPSGEPIAR